MSSAKRAAFEQCCFSTQAKVCTDSMRKQRHHSLRGRHCHHVAYCVSSKCLPAYPKTKDTSEMAKSDWQPDCGQSAGFTRRDHAGMREPNRRSVSASWRATWRKKLVWLVCKGRRPVCFAVRFRHVHRRACSTGTRTNNGGQEDYRHDAQKSTCPINM